MKKLLFILMILFTAGFVFGQQNQTARDVAGQEGIRNRPDPATGQLTVDSPGASVADDPEIQDKLKKNDDFYSDFQAKFNTLKTYNNTKQQRDEFKAMQTMIDRQKRLVDYKMEQIQILERAGKTVPLSEFSQLRDLMNRYHTMTVDLNKWVNKIQ